MLIYSIQINRINENTKPRFISYSNRENTVSNKRNRKATSRINIHAKSILN